LSLGKIFGIRKLESLDYPVACLRDPTFGHFSRTLTCDMTTAYTTKAWHHMVKITRSMKKIDHRN